MATSTTDEFHTNKDIAPGDDKEAHGSVRNAVLGYGIGLVLAAGLTVASFLAAGADGIYGPGIPVALITLAIAQMGVHLVFFLHITTGPDNTNNIMALAFGVLIVLLLIGGSLWITSNLHANMTPTDPFAPINAAPF